MRVVNRHSLGLVISFRARNGNVDICLGDLLTVCEELPLVTNILEGDVHLHAKNHPNHLNEFGDFPPDYGFKQFVYSPAHRGSKMFGLVFLDRRLFNKNFF